MDMSYSKVMEWFDTLVDSFVENKRNLVIGIAGIGLLAAAGVGYSYYNEWTQAHAHKDFVEALRYYDAPVTGKSRATNGAIEFANDNEKWSKVEEVFKQGYEKNSRSGLGTMFKVYQANAVALQNNIDKAIEILASAVNAIPSKEVKDFYALELALMRLDSTNAVVQKAGFEELKKIAEDQHNYANESGLFYIGYYFWNQKDFAQVKNYWQQFMVKYGLKDMKQQSGFVDIVRSKLKLISADW